MQTNVSNSNTSDALQSAAREQMRLSPDSNGALMGKEKIDPGPSSPSPRGIETWGPCSPFNLPEPTGPLDFIEPEELSKLLHVSDISNIDASCGEDDSYVLPDNGFMDVDGSFESGGLQSLVGEGQVDAVNDSPDGFDSFSKPDEDDSSLSHHEANRDPSLSPFRIEAFLSPEHKVLHFPDANMPDGEVKMGTMCGAEHEEEDLCFDFDVGNPEDLNDVSVISNGEIVDMVCETRKASEPDVRDHRELEGKRYAKKNSKGNFAEGKRAAGDGPSEGKGKDAKIFSEDELKRIRRVKNRASVEKCRTKQRLRMEALQNELATLTSENKALRDLTSWMDSSVDEISSQVTMFSRCIQTLKEVDKNI